MAVDKQFHERLNRINKNQAVQFEQEFGPAPTAPEPEYAQAQEPAAKPRRRRSPVFAFFAMLPGAFMFAGLVGAGYLYFGLDKNGFGGSDSVQVASLGGIAPALVDAMSDVANPTQTQTPADWAHSNLLPEAPKDWIRVTTADAVRPEILDDIRANWPKPKSGNAFSLENNLGYRKLIAFVEATKAGPGADDQITRAIYMGGNGEYVFYEAKLLDADSSLGAENRPADWFGKVVSAEKDRLTNGEIMERLSLGGFKVTNRTKPEGEGIFRTPVAGRPDVRTVLRLSSPLSNQVLLDMEGYTSSNTVAWMLRKLDKPTIRAGLSEG